MSFAGTSPFDDPCCFFTHTRIFILYHAFLQGENSFGNHSKQKPTPEQLILGQSGRSRQGDLVKGVDVRQLLAQGLEMRQARYFHKGQMGNLVL